MNFLATRFVLWFVTLALFPIPPSLFAQSFQVEVLQRITLAALPQERLSVDLSERVLLHLENAEKKESDPWLRDDLRIAWITVLWSRDGIPEWAWHRNTSAHAAATFRVLNCLPEEVWPRIVARRQAMLGKEYEEFFGGSVSPRKPARSVGLAEQRNKAA